MLARGARGANSPGVTFGTSRAGGECPAPLPSEGQLWGMCSALAPVFPGADAPAAWVELAR